MLVDRNQVSRMLESVVLILNLLLAPPGPAIAADNSFTRAAGIPSNVEASVVSDHPFWTSSLTHSHLKKTQWTVNINTLELTPFWTNDDGCEFYQSPQTLPSHSLSLKFGLKLMCAFFKHYRLFTPFCTVLRLTMC